jgi:hypothetical protein
MRGTLSEGNAYRKVPAINETLLPVFSLGIGSSMGPNGTAPAFESASPIPLVD